MATVHASPVAVRLDPRPVHRIGMIALATDLTSERDAARLLPPEVAMHTTRVPFENPTTPDTLRRLAGGLTGAADLLVPGLDLAAIIFSCTAASATIGDAAVRAAIQTARPGVPVVTPPDAATQAFAALGVRRIALLTPYLPETTAPMVRYFQARGLTIVAAQCLGLADDREMARVAPQTILAAAEAVDTADAEAVFLSCTALPALGLIDALEATLGKPVVSSNQASLWQALGHAAVAIEGPGRLFAVPASVPA
ncbi:aspartate/glutamate racemase family protein [Acuticoccus sp. I52.16.1]|uniref:aspartate racemase/maleate isomerase family protein n=1 Tax=Acuticoccus sp. I52.16.1 TaxID=2928472 RepID=UPI001FD2D7BA|nr:aspartate/glutamate racemase family protein [Acuticoccus sp. I52.16.1]UOM32731.1 aspartate/glutamate racemase family protein [Acuticoccus sp. I52.16.1]